MAARVGFKLATLRMLGTELTTEPPRPAHASTSCGGSRYPARSNLICFPVVHIYVFVGGEPKFIAKLDVEPLPDFPLLDPPLSGYQ